ncbi:MAG: hypothetical protein R6U96_11730 [Promethearchaeia archaeon]
MDLKKLTEAHIQRKKERLNLQIGFKKSIKEAAQPYILIIKSYTKSYLKITIYPLGEKKVVKILMISEEKDEEILCNAIDILKKYEIIHTSGLMMIKNQIYHECYINMNRETKKYKELITSLKQMEKYLELRIEEIELKKVNE